MAPNVAAVCKSSFFHLRNIIKIHKFLSVDSAKTLVHAFIASTVDYCNSLLYGQPKCVLRDLKRVLNCSARLIYSTSKFKHVTPLFSNLHWLFVEQRIVFKIALITFKARMARNQGHLSPRSGMRTAVCGLQRFTALLNYWWYYLDQHSQGKAGLSHKGKTSIILVPFSLCQEGRQACQRSPVSH